VTDMLDPLLAYRDRFAAVGEAPIDLTDLVPESFLTPTSWAITAGNAAGDWTLSGSTIDFSVAGAAADMPNSPYTLTIQATWASLPAAYQTASTTVTVICPADTRYVDPAGGSDAAAGTSKAAAWTHATGDPNATGNAASFSPSVLTLISIKGGTTQIRSNYVAPSNNNIVYASSIGWGTGRAILSGLDLLPAGTAASSGEAFANPFLASINKYSLGYAWQSGQYLVDNGQLIFPAQWPASGTDPLLDSQDPNRQLTGGMYRYPATEVINFGTASTTITGTAAAAILAAFPTGKSTVGYVVWHWVVPNEVQPFVITAHNVATGQITFDTSSEATTSNLQFGTSATPAQPANGDSVVAAGKTYTFKTVLDTGDGTILIGATVADTIGNFVAAVNLAAGAGTKYGSATTINPSLSASVNGTYRALMQIKVTGTSLNSVALSIGVGTILTWSIATMVSGVQEVNGTTAFQIVGHPWSIGAANQFAGKPGDTYVLAWLSDGVAPEILTRKIGITANSPSSLGAYGLLIQGYYNDTASAEGAGISVSRSSNFTYNFANNEIKWLVNHATKSGGIRTVGSGTATSNRLDRNYIHDSVRASGIRYSCAQTDGIQAVKNRVERLTRTGIYIVNMKNSLVQGNKLVYIISAHGNGFTFYRTGVYVPDNNTIQYNYTENVIRPLTKDAHANSLFTGNIFESDELNNDPVRAYGSYSTDVWSRNMCMRYRNSALTGTYSMNFGLGGGGACPYSNNVIDGVVLQSPYAAVGTANLITNAVAGTGADDALVNGISDQIGGLGSDNVYSPYLWDGTITAPMKNQLGVGRIGNQLIYSIASVFFPPLANQTVSTLVTSAMALVDTPDATRPISVSGAGSPQWRQADYPGGGNPTAWTSSSGTIDTTKYLQVRQTTSASNETEQTASIDLGDGNVSTWTATTLKAKDVPWVAINTSDTWNTTSQGIAADSQLLTIALKFNFSAAPGSAALIFGPTAGSLYLRVQTLVSGGVGGLRFTFRNSSNVTICQFDLAAQFTVGQDYDVQATADLTQPNSTAGLRAFIGSSAATISVLTFTSGATIAFSGAAVYKFGNLNLNAGFGMLYLSNRWVDITDPDIRERFTNGRRLGPNGENVDGTAPAILLLGTEAQWEAGGGINRGTSAMKFVPQGGTDVTPVAGTVTTWPYYTYATALTITSPADIELGNSAAFTVATDGATANNISVTVNDGAQSGTFNPASPIVLVNADAPSLSFSYTPALGGNKTIAASASGLTGASDVLGVTLPPVAVTYTFDLTVTDTYSGLPTVVQRSLTVNP